MFPHHIVIWVVFVFYLFLLLFIGFFAQRKFSRTYEDFVVAGKNLGKWVTAISASASAESAWLILGLSGYGFIYGFGSYWIALGGILGYWFNALFIISQLKKDTDRFKSLTISDYIESKLNDKYHIFRTLSAIIVTFFMTAYVVAQFTGSGKQLEGMGLASYKVGVLIGGLIIAIYVILGGYAAVSYTDLIQGILMVFVLAIFPLIAIFVIGGPFEFFKKAGELGLTHLWGPDKFSFFVLGFLIGEAIGIAFGYPGMPHVVIRYFTVKDIKEGKRAGLIAILWGFFAYFGSCTLGIAGRVLVEMGKLPNPGDPEKILPLFVVTFLNPVLAGIVLSAVTAAIMSTADSQLMYSSTTILNDVYLIFKGKRPQQKFLILGTRIVILILSLIALLFALIEVRFIYRFVLYAWSALGSAFSPVIILSLYDKKFNKYGAITCLIVGPVVTILWKDIFKLTKYLYELFPAFLISLFLGFLVSRVSKKLQKN
ncbi:MAG: sodium/proline symporter [Candidatus Hydrothermales bacterium]